jgi:uncharacterized protein YdeI (YjbR/CyaY-like superfamily)
MQTDARIDEYINKSAPFARPVLQHVRELVHEACPEVAETIKWGFPHFTYKGILCSMAAFKQHCSFGFWKASIMKDPERILKRAGKTEMGNFGKIASIKDLPADKIMLSYIKEAVLLNEKGTKVMARGEKARTEIPVPEELTLGLKKNKKALASFEQLSPSHKREYLKWITEAKMTATRQRRIETTIEWLSEAKGPNWKYEK